MENWNDADGALKEMGELRLAVMLLETEMNKRINEIKEQAAARSKPLLNKIDEINKALEDFAFARRHDMDGKSKILNFGALGFRQVTRITYNTRKTEELIENLKKHGMFNCVNVKESVNKDALKLYPEADIAKVGAFRAVSDNFFAEPDLEKIK